MSKKCFVCRNSNTEFLLKKDGYDIFSCVKCGLNFVFPMPSDKKLEKIYSSDAGYSHSDRGFEEESVMKGCSEKLVFFRRNKVKRVLDVGCASGGLVYALDKKGFDAVGIDLDKDSIKFGKGLGLDLRHGRIEDFKFKRGEFDAINLGDIIEHVKDPERLLSECLRILKKRGLIVISTPNTNAFFPKATKWFYEKFGLMWSHPTPPYHLFDFSDKNLKIVLNRMGVQALKIDYAKIAMMYSIYHTGYFEEFRKKMKGNSRRDIFGAILRGIRFVGIRQIMASFIYFLIFYLDKMFGRKGDHMTIYGKKKGN